MQKHDTALGTKLGPRIALLISRAIVLTHAKLATLKHRIAMSVFHAISDEISEEVDTTLGPLLAKLHDSIDETHPAYPSIHFMHTVSGQLKALAGTGLQISGLLGSISAIMNNELADVVYAYIRLNPHLLPDVSTLLQMNAAALLDDAATADAIAAQGINSGWSQNMMLLAKSYPTVADGLEMMRRGLISRDQFALWCGLNGIPESIVGIYLHMVNNPISVADAALAVLRGNIDQATADALATANGVSLNEFQILVNNTGEPPGLMQLLEAYRRGFIDQATLEQGIRDSRYRNEWIPMLEKLRYEPMSVADAVNATVQNQMDAATARGIADQNGLTPGAFDILLNTAGEPLSPTEMWTLYNRGQVTQDQVYQASRESRLKDKYVPMQFLLHEHTLPIFTIQTALRTGGMDQATALKSITSLGYSAHDAQEIINSASQQRLKTYRDQVVAAAHSLYEDNIIGADTVNSITSQMGYTDDETKFITQSSELRREAAITHAAINATRSKYLAHHIDEQIASGLLDSFQVPSQQRDQLLAVWTIEASAYTKSLTEAQIVKAFKDSLITQDDAMSRLQAMGYNETDSTLLIQGA